jgi:hypothetical protein
MFTLGSAHDHSRDPDNGRGRDPDPNSQQIARSQRKFVPSSGGGILPLALSSTRCGALRKPQAITPTPTIPYFPKKSATKM